MSVADITAEALKRGLISPKSDRPASYVRAAIRKDNRRREQSGAKPRFARNADGSYSLTGD
jgi:hypothetical protein